jgi:hypothetical protein
MNNKEAVFCIDSLLKDYKEASLKSKYADLSDLHNEALTKSIKVRALNIIESATEEGSVYRKQSYHVEGGCVSIPQLIGILEPLKADLVNNRIRLGGGERVNADNRGSCVVNKVITKEGLEKLTFGQLIKVLSIGAWVWIVGIECLIMAGSYNIGHYLGMVQYVEKTPQILLKQLNPDQLVLVREIWKYQKINNLKEVAISRDGFILDGRKEKTINLMELLPGNMVDQARFERVMVSVPIFFMEHLSKINFSSPYRVAIPEEARKYLDKNL